MYLFVAFITMIFNLAGWGYILWYPLLITIALVFYLFALPYAIGSAEYARNNNNGSKESEDCWQSVRDEYRELCEAIERRQLWEGLLEFFDVLHGVIKYCVVTYTPKWFYFHWFCWLLIFPFVLPISIKLGIRYRKWNCIRNHYRENANHKCVINDFIHRKK